MKKLSDQAILNELGKTKKSQKLDKSTQVGTLKAFIVTYSTNAQKSDNQNPSLTVEKVQLQWTPSI